MSITKCCAAAEEVMKAKEPLPWEGVEPATYYLKNRKARIQVTVHICNRSTTVFDLPCSVKTTCMMGAHPSLHSSQKIQPVESNRNIRVQASWLQKPKEAVHSMLKVHPWKEVPQTIDEVMNRTPKKKTGRLKSGPNKKDFT
jgi:hypothetical protein